MATAYIKHSSRAIYIALWFSVEVLASCLNSYGGGTAFWGGGEILLLDVFRYTLTELLINPV